MLADGFDIVDVGKIADSTGLAEVKHLDQLHFRKKDMKTIIVHCKIKRM